VAETTVEAEPFVERAYATALRAGLELVGWIGLPIALWGHSIVLAILVDVVLIGVPAVLQTPGDKPGPGGGAVIAVPGWVTIVMVVAELGAAVAAAWLLFWTWAAVLVTVLALICQVTEQPRWKHLLRA
jgi:hypothetical protein